VLALQRLAGNAAVARMIGASGQSSGSGSASPASRSAGARPLTVQRHASNEHFMLGSLTPTDVEKLARGTEIAEKGEAGDLIDKFKSLFTSKPKKSDEEIRARAQAGHVIETQLTSLQKWRTTGGPDPGQVRPGDRAISQEWGGQLVLVECKDGKKVPATVGDMNALPDFYGSIEDVKRLDENVLRATFQVIRRETFIGLEALKARLAGREYKGKEEEFEKTQKGKGTWKGAENVDVNLRPGGFLGLGDVTNIEKTDELTRGKTTGGQGAGFGASYSSALARNACHFPPESWLRWKEYHERARAVIDSATTDDVDEKVNEGLVLSSFGEHYLQDSFAAGHLINKGYIMAYCLTKTSEITNAWRGMGSPQIREMLRKTAHREAYQAPKLAKSAIESQQKADVRMANDDVLGSLESQLEGIESEIKLDQMKARDPQSAKDRAAREGISEVEAAGLDPNVISMEQYRTWLVDSWYQKITNTLHDKFCIQGLEVGSPDQPQLFKIFGDNNMLRSAEGAKYTAETSRMSIDDINNLGEWKRQQLRALEAGGGVLGPKPDATLNIIARFPDRVKVDGKAYDLVDWATGPAARALADDACDEVKNSFVAAISPVKPLSEDLVHQPF
jgi:hypothetical protein